MFDQLSRLTGWPEELTAIVEKYKPPGAGSDWGPSLSQCVSHYHLGNDTRSEALGEFYDSRQKFIEDLFKNRPTHDNGIADVAALTVAGNGVIDGIGRLNRSTLEMIHRKDNRTPFSWLRLEFYIFKHSKCADLKALYAYRALGCKMHGGTLLAKRPLPPVGSGMDVCRQLHPLLVLVEGLELAGLAEALLEYQIDSFGCAFQLFVNVFKASATRSPMYTNHAVLTFRFHAVVTTECRNIQSVL